MFKKSVVLALLLSLGFSVAQPRNSEAGIIIGAVNGGAIGALAGAGIGLGAALATSVVTGVVANIPAEGMAIIFTVIFPVIPGMVLLDVEGSLPEDQLASLLSRELPGIDSPETISDAARLIQEKFTHAQRLAPQANAVSISLTRDEVIDLLAPAGISPEDSPVEFEQAMKVLN